MSDEMCRGGHLVAKIDAFPGQLQANVREHFRPRIHVASEAILAVVDTRIRLIGAAVPLNVLVRQTPKSVPFALVEKFNEPPTEIHILLRHRLPPRLGEPVGGRAGLVDVGVDRHARDSALYPRVDKRLLPLNTATTANRTCVLANHGKNDSAPQVESLHIEI